MVDQPDYIKQCEKAVEIQKPSSQYVAGDWFADTGVVYVVGSHESIRYDFTDHVWLPRQDQLQAMVLPSPVFNLDPEDFDTKIDYAFWLAREFAEGIQERKWSQQTMEQLWLGYVMKKKYGKVWNNEDWVAA